MIIKYNSNFSQKDLFFISLLLIGLLNYSNDNFAYLIQKKLNKNL